MKQHHTSIDVWNNCFSYPSRAYSFAFDCASYNIITFFLYENTSWGICFFWIFLLNWGSKLGLFIYPNLLAFAHTSSNYQILRLKRFNHKCHFVVIFCLLYNEKLQKNLQFWQIHWLVSITLRYVSQLNECGIHRLTPQVHLFGVTLLLSQPIVLNTWNFIAYAFASVFFDTQIEIVKRLSIRFGFFVFVHTNVERMPKRQNKSNNWIKSENNVREFYSVNLFFGL